MANGWTPERRARQAEAIKRWQPWKSSTGPKTIDGKSATRRNAWKGGTRPMLRTLAKTLRDQCDWLDEIDRDNEIPNVACGDPVSPGLIGAEPQLGPVSGGALGNGA